MILKKRCIIHKEDVMEPAHLEQSQMLIILSVTVEETGEKDGVHVGNHQLRGGLNKTDQIDTRCNCRSISKISLDQKFITNKSFLWPPMQNYSG